MPYDTPERTVDVKPGRKIVGKSGESLTIITMSPRCIADCHTHIESGDCVPLPLLWQRDYIPDVDRKTLNFLVKIKMPAAGNLQVKSTAVIGSRLADEIKEAFSPQSIVGQSDYYKNCDVFPFAVINMMDMEYAWLGGFEGQAIYFENETPWYFYEREHARDKKEQWRKRLLPGENQKTFSAWKKQFDETIVAIRNNPLRLIGMYHYDPRRWNFPKSREFDGDYFNGGWDYPFNEIFSAIGKGLFIGFKLYPPLGYKPLDPRLPYLHDKLKDGDCFYARCDREGIPVLVHCSPGGMYTHEIKHYMEYDTGLFFQSKLRIPPPHPLMRPLLLWTKIRLQSGISGTTMFIRRSGARSLSGIPHSNSALLISAEMNGKEHLRATGSGRSSLLRKSIRMCTLIFRAGIWTTRKSSLRRFLKTSGIRISGKRYYSAPTGS
jgi:hypothetical protein